MSGMMWTGEGRKGAGKPCSWTNINDGTNGGGANEATGAEGKHTRGGRDVCISEWRERWKKSQRAGLL